MGKYSDSDSDRARSRKRKSDRRSSGSRSSSSDGERKRKKKKKHKSKHRRDRSESKSKAKAPIFKQETQVLSIEGEAADETNPFGDPNLDKAFVWSKKLEREGLGKASKKVIRKVIDEKRNASAAELEKVRKNRLEREKMKADRDAEMELLQREKEVEQYKEWSAQETRFHLEQARERSKIRIAEGNPKTIDLLSRYIISSTEGTAEDMDVEMREAPSYLIGMTKRDLEDLTADVKVYQALDKGLHDEYWRDIGMIVEEELRKLRMRDPEDPAFVGNRRESIHQAVSRDVTGILKGKTYPQLALLETQIMKKIKSGEQGVDVSYWESLLEMLTAHMARARLKERHQKMLQSKLCKLKQEQNVLDSRPRFPAGATDSEPGPSTGSSGAPLVKAASTAADAALLARPWEELSETEARKRRGMEYESGSYSPVYDPEDSLEKGIEIVDAVEDLKRIDFKRTHKEVDPTLELEAVAKKGMGDDEAQFSVEAPLAQKTYLWSDKYRPRKPRYFNRVHTGFEWNKYNQTHYDLDNPPPKIVQGYKFNIFYPDLLNPAEAPIFQLIPCEDNPDFAMLKFEAGPPYEDIAFKVINREWEISHKRGYRCQFQNGIFQLWFHFKKYRYRR